jgi:hypothetical protein
MHFPTELFDIIKSYNGIVGMSKDEIKMINKVNIKDLRGLCEAQTKLVLFEKTDKAQDKRRKILRKLFYSKRPADWFKTTLHFYNECCKQDKHDLYYSIAVGDEIRITHNHRCVQIGRVLKNNAKSFIFAEYKYHYERIPNETHRLVKIFSPSETPSEMREPRKITTGLHSIDTPANNGCRSFALLHNNRHPVYAPNVDDRHLIRD